MATRANAVKSVVILLPRVPRTSVAILPPSKSAAGIRVTRESRKPTQAAADRGDEIAYPPAGTEGERFRALIMLPARFWRVDGAWLSATTPEAAYWAWVRTMVDGTPARATAMVTPTAAMAPQK